MTSWKGTCLMLGQRKRVVPDRVVRLGLVKLG